MIPELKLNSRKSKNETSKDAKSKQDQIFKQLKDAQGKAAIIHQRQKAERLEKMKEFGLLSADATIEDADQLGAPKVIPFEDMQHIQDSNPSQFEDILKDMGLDGDVADILDGESEEEETKQIDTSGPKISASLNKKSKGGQKKFEEDDDAGVDEKLAKEFKESLRLARPPAESETDSDVAPLPSVVDTPAPKQPEATEEDKMYAASESARVAAVKHPKQNGGVQPKPVVEKKAARAQIASDSGSDDDEEDWFASQRSARSRPQAKPAAQKKFSSMPDRNWGEDEQY